jgi:hypothetical protein
LIYGYARVSTAAQGESSHSSGLNRLSTAAVHFGAVIPEIDIWRAAQLMLKRHGERALEESAARADELALAGDHDGAATWRRIMAAVTQLENKTPPGRCTELPNLGSAPPCVST